MEKLFDKIDSYNIFTNIIPGAVLTKMLSLLGLYTVQVEGAVANLFLYYFFGLVASRAGSLIVEKRLMAWKMIKYAPHEEYLKAAQKDCEIKKLLEINNMYRAFSGVFLVLCVTKLYQLVAARIQVSPTTSEWFAVIVLLLLFTFSFMKQTRYIVRRVTATNKENDPSESPKEDNLE